MSGRGRALRPGGVVRALLRFLLLVVLGFAAGLVIGIVSEEPELLAGHLRGESTAVPLSESTSEFMGAAGATPPSVPPVSDLAASNGAAGTSQTVTGIGRAVDPPPVASPPARGARNVERARSKRSPVSAPRPGPAPVSASARDSASASNRAPAPGSRGKFAIQVGAFSEERAAQGLADELKQDGYPVAILPSTDNAGRWRVRVQPFADEASAQAMAKRLKKDEGLPTWVLREEPKAGSERGAQ